MYARISTLAGSPDQIDEGLVRDNVLPQLQQQDGFNGMTTLADRQTGKTLGITFYCDKRFDQARFGAGLEPTGGLREPREPWRYERSTWGFVYDEEHDLVRFRDSRFAFSREHADWGAA